MQKFEPGGSVKKKRTNFSPIAKVWSLEVITGLFIAIDINNLNDIKLNIRVKRFKYDDMSFWDMMN